MSTTTPHPVAPAAEGPAPIPAKRWRPRHVVGVCLASAAILVSGASAVTAGVIHVVDEDRRVGDYLTSDAVDARSAGHALTVEEIDLDGLSGDWLLGTARARVTGADGGALFIGVASTEDAKAYLDGVAYSTVDDVDDIAYVEHAGGTPSAAPGELDIWTVQASGAGTQTVRWEPEGGDWTVVVMNADGSAGVDVRADVGATAPILPRAVRWLVAASVVSGTFGALTLIWVVGSLRRRRAGTR